MGRRNILVEIERFAIDLGGSIDDVRSEIQRLATRLRQHAGISNVFPRTAA